MCTYIVHTFLFHTVGLILIYVAKTMSKTALLTAIDYGTGVDVEDVMEESKDENIVEEVGVNYMGFGFGGGSYGGDNVEGDDCRGDDERYFD